MPDADLTAWWSRILELQQSQDPDERALFQAWWHNHKRMELGPPENARKSKKKQGKRTMAVRPPPPGARSRPTRAQSAPSPETETRKSKGKPGTGKKSGASSKHRGRRRRRDSEEEDTAQSSEESSEDEPVPVDSDGSPDTVDLPPRKGTSGRPVRARPRRRQPSPDPPRQELLDDIVPGPQNAILATDDMTIVDPRVPPLDKIVTLAHGKPPTWVAHDPVRVFPYLWSLAKDKEYRDFLISWKHMVRPSYTKTVAMLKSC